MSLPREVLKYIMESTSGCSEKSIDLIMEYESIRQRVADRNRRVATIKREAEERITDLMNQKICKHQVTKTHGDPSGNGDTTIECLICGEFIRERSVRFT